MKIYSPSVFALLFSAILIVACSRKEDDIAPIEDLQGLTVSPSPKGWELYSWPEGNRWKFSFMAGTNRLKTFTEVTSLNGAALIRVTGLDSAKMVLNKFPAGEDIMLVGQGWLQNAWQGQYGNLQLPPQSTIDALKSLSSRKNVKFTVAN